MKSKQGFELCYNAQAVVEEGRRSPQRRYRTARTRETRKPDPTTLARLQAVFSLG